jgi:hypothetical protein
MNVERFGSSVESTFGNAGGGKGGTRAARRALNQCRRERLGLQHTDLQRRRPLSPPMQSDRRRLFDLRGHNLAARRRPRFLRRLVCVE